MFFLFLFAKDNHESQACTNGKVVVVLEEGDVFVDDRVVRRAVNLQMRVE